MNVLSGCKQLLESPSGTFSLVCLLCLTVLSWHLGIAWATAAAAAWTAFFAIVPAILAIVEHREEMAKINNSLPITPIVPTLPPRGQP